MELLQPEFNLVTWDIFSFRILLLWFVALVSILKSDFKDSVMKLIGTVVIIFLPVLGSLLYLFVGRGQRINNNQL